jgi:hypothetical protein
MNALNVGRIWLQPVLTQRRVLTQLHMQRSQFKQFSQFGRFVQISKWQLLVMLEAQPIEHQKILKIEFCS